MCGTYGDGRYGVQLVKNLTNDDTRDIAINASEQLKSGGLIRKNVDLFDVQDAIHHTLNTLLNERFRGNIYVDYLEVNE